MLLSKEKESRVEFNPGLNANRSSNNWAQLSKKKQSLSKFMKRWELSPNWVKREKKTQMEKRMDKLEVDWNTDCNCGFSKTC